MNTLNSKFGVSAWTWKNDIWFEYIEVTGEHTFWYTATQMCDFTNESLKYGMLFFILDGYCSFLFYLQLSMKKWLFFIEQHEANEHRIWLTKLSLTSPVCPSLDLI